MKDILNMRMRFSRKDKKLFLKTIETELTKLGYEVDYRRFDGLLTSINIETKNNNPEFIFLAHYDTGTIGPIWMHWLMKLIGINRQLLIIAFFIVFICFLVPFFGSYLPVIEPLVSVLIFISLLVFLIPNTTNYDDNTSGVISLIKLAKKLKEKGLENSKFIFVDNEELGLFGSAAHKVYLEKNKLIPKGCKVISIDCVGGPGEIPLIVKNCESAYLKLFQDAINKEFDECKISKMIFPASDNFSFRKYGAINISFVCNSIIPGGYYIADIHSHKDYKIDLERIDKLCDAITDLLITEANRE